jgi:hypothetical protein
MQLVLALLKGRRVSLGAALASVVPQKLLDHERH